MSKKTIPITCEGSDVRSIDELVPYQGNLKSLPEEEYQNLKTKILDPEIGFCFPIHLWKNKILDGHQRLTVLKRLRDEDGFNTKGALERAKRKNQTMYDYIKEAWNTPNSAHSPYKYFSGIMFPIGLDQNKNVIYEYRGK